MDTSFLLIVNCSLFIPAGRAGRSHHRAPRLSFFIIFIVIVEKKITLSVIFFSTVVGIVIGIHCNALYHGKVKVGKSEGNFDN